MRFLTSIGSSVFLALTLAVAAACTGCGSDKTLIVPDPSATTGLPTAATAGPVNTYSGTQAPGMWNFTLDNTNEVFSYQPVTYSAAATTGTMTAVNGFSVLSNGGLALEVEGRAAVLRPGDSTTAPVFGVPQTECYPITGRLRFQYVGALPTYATADFVYGSVAASTDSTGASWTFEDMQGDYDYGPASFAATCSTSSGLSAISFTGGTSILNETWYKYGYQISDTDTLPADTQSNIRIGPSGFFVGDQSDPSGVVYGTTTITPTGSAVVGVAEPTAALSATTIASKNYLGFIYEPGIFTEVSYAIETLHPTVTIPVSFTGLTGEAYTNNDVTQALDSTTAMTISLGTQDSTYHGLYQSVSITVLDPSQNCANGGFGTSGLNSDGYITCTFSGTAVVGNPEGKYAIFITSSNPAAVLNGRPMQIYLFQQ